MAWIAGLCAAWICVLADATAADATGIFLRNASFEVAATAKAPSKENALGKWVLKSEFTAPTEWTLSSAYPGELEVMEGDAADGQRFLRVVAGPKRAAHLAQRCPALRRGLGYEVSLRYRGGPVELKVYEYDGSGKLKADRAFAKGVPTPVRDGSWRTLAGIYMVPNGIERITLALAIPEGGEADLDEVRIGSFERSSERLNVRDFGASGSEFETTADTIAGSNVIAVQDIGDFQVGHQVTVSKCNPHIADGRVWGRVRGEGTSDFNKQVEARGYDGTLGNWTAYILDFKGTDPPTFRWSDDLALTWKEPVPVTGGWQELNGGVEVKLGNVDFWTKPVLATFSGRDQLVSTIVKIEGNALTLADAAPVQAKGCVVQHTDSGPLQAAFNRAVGEGRNVFIPSGCYRLTSGLNLSGADGITVEGENEERTILDISNGQGTCMSIVGGTSVTIRNLRFRGFSGFDERKQMGFMRAHGYAHMWGFYVKHCNAIGIRSPERILVENCHATGMSAECFYSGSSSRKGNEEPDRYTKSIVYRNCTVADCARNAFNNNDFAENTAVLYCRIQDVGGCSWEGASRFVKIVGNYMRNAGTVAMGNIRSRDENFDILPSGQHIVAHNTFEQQMVYGGCAIRSSAGSTPVVISNNIFVNFNTSAIEATGFGDHRNLPAGNTIITGNAIDLTCIRDDSRARFGISVSADDATISDNQIYVRGDVDPEVKGIVLAEPARNIVVHDNIVRGCAVGLLATKTEGRVEQVIDRRTFKSSGRLPWPRRGTHCYRGDRIAWVANGKTAYVLGPEIETFDPDEGVFRLSGDCDLKKGAAFSLQSPQGLAWSIHHNVINNCARLVDLDVFGGPTAVFEDNLLSRGETPDVKIAVEIHGRFRVTDNQFSGFDEPDSVALMLHPDPLGRTARLICRDNVFDRCTTPIGEGASGVWKAAVTSGNVFGEQVETLIR
ncbi:MAG: right-handed parallel beta-helix repeat-containing protein [Planctomycetes bacterium]|nr:right-handed parallel beta-helix repeat-containing protein [Planctomycetota bacterium]